MLAPKTGRYLRWLAIFAGGTFAAYSIIAYKTPWCLIAWAWPYFIVFGVGVDWVMRRLDAELGLGLALMLFIVSFAHSDGLNFNKYADENEPYVYVQTKT